MTDLIGYSAAFIGAFVFVPQALKVWKTKETKDLSLLSFLLIVIGAILWVMYGILLNAAPIILVNTIIGILAIFIVYMKLKYK